MIYLYTKYKYIKVWIGVPDLFYQAPVVLFFFFRIAAIDEKRMTFLSYPFQSNLTER